MSIHAKKQPCRQLETVCLVRVVVNQKLINVLCHLALPQRHPEEMSQLVSHMIALPSNEPPAFIVLQVLKLSEQVIRVRTASTARRSDDGYVLGRQHRHAVFELDAEHCQYADSGHVADKFLMLV